MQRSVEHARRHLGAPAHTHADRWRVIKGALGVASCRSCASKLRYMSHPASALALHPKPRAGWQTGGQDMHQRGAQTRGMEEGRQEQGGGRNGRDQQRVPARCCAPPPRHRRAPPLWPLFASHPCRGQSCQRTFSLDDARENTALVCGVFSGALAVPGLALS